MVPLKSPLGVYVTVVPSVVTVPVVSPELIVGLLTVRVSPSVSVSLDSTVNEVALSSSVIVPVSSTATGASFTDVTVIVTDVESAPSALSAAK